MKKLLIGITALLLSLHATAAPVQDPLDSDFKCNTSVSVV